MLCGRSAPLRVAAKRDFLFFIPHPSFILHPFPNSSVPASTILLAEWARRSLAGESPLEESPGSTGQGDG
jgi:hypothetical protein